MSEKLPRAVPLPEVSQYTDEIVFGNLGLPVGFDDEQLVVNLRGFRRFQRAAGIGAISAIGVTGEVGENDYSISGIGADGSATISGAMKRQKKPLSQGVVTFPEERFSTGGKKLTTYYNNPDALIKINNAETNQRIKDKSERYVRGVFDAKARAKYLDAGIRTGLLEAAKDANLDKEKLRDMLGTYALYAGGWFLVGEGSLTGALGYALALGVFTNVLEQVGIVPMLSDDDKTFSERAVHNTKTWRKSLFVGVELDRLAAGMAVAATTRFVKARP